MSQLQFQAPLVGANSTTKAVVPASAPSNNTAANFVSSIQLPCSPIAPARVVLKNTEKYPVYFKVFPDRKSSFSAAVTTGSNESSLFEELVYIHPSRGAVKPNKS